MFRKKLFIVAAASAVFAGGRASQASVQITEFMSNTTSSALGEFVEFTNTGASPQSMVGWSEDDSTRTANKSGHSLSAFGTLAPGESAIFTETDPDTFRTQWWGSVAGAPAALKIIGPYTNDNLSSSGDEVNLYDNNGVNVDRLTYSAASGGNAAGVSRDAPANYLPLTNTNSSWVNSSSGDVYGSFRAVGYPEGSSINVFGNPGTFTPSVTPEPAALSLLAVAGLM